MAKLKIGVLGTGDVGQVLGAGFAALEHDVKIGSREPGSDKVKKWLARAGAQGSAGSFADAARFGDVVVLATSWGGTKNALELAGPGNLSGKVLIDATNPLDFSHGMPPRLAVGHTDSGGENVQRWVPQARVVKCFNIVGNPHMVRPSFPGGNPDMFLAGNDADAKKTVSELCQELGWSAPIDLGGIECARYLEPLAMIWVSYMFRSGSGNHAFALLRK